MKNTIKKCLLVTFLLLPLAIIMSTRPALASTDRIAEFQAAYPASDSYNNAGCQLCHESASGGASWNGYGWAIRAAGGVTAVEGNDSDSDPAGASNLVEIDANAQPGWTVGNNNTIYTTSSTTPNQAPPGGIVLLDPASAGMCTLDVIQNPTLYGAVEVADTESRTIVISNVGDLDCNISDLSLAGSANFTFGAGAPAGAFSIPVGGSRDVPVDYTPTAVTLSETGTMTISSDDPDRPVLPVDLEGAGTITLVNLIVEYDVRNGTLMQESGSATDKFFSNDILLPGPPVIESGYTQPIEIRFVNTEDPCSILGSASQRIELVHLTGTPFPESFNTLLGTGHGASDFGPGLILEYSGIPYSSASADINVMLLDPEFEPGGELTEFDTTCIWHGGRCESTSLSLADNPPHNPDITDNSISFDGFKAIVRNTDITSLTIDTVNFNLIAGGEINVDPAVSEVSIDIKPSSDQNPINPSGSGVIPVAILSTTDFDALTVDRGTICLLEAKVRRTGKKQRLQCSKEDINYDGLLDLMCKVNADEVNVSPGQNTAVLIAETFDGTRIRGTDNITVVP